ncbi:MAG: macro domain-containing protein [Euryarchaeota archaeon]|nr:macro domain-containing protein [Euryarchaeota archaeon]
MHPRIEVTKGDITEEEVDVVVNAANERLKAGGGVDGAIHRAAGPTLQEELDRRYSGCATGEAVVTAGHGLPARHVVHTVGPVWKDGTAKEDELLTACHRNALRCAAEVGAGTVALPAISTGAFGYPVERAARVATRAVVSALKELPEIECVRFVCFDDGTKQAFRSALEVTLKEMSWESEEDERPGDSRPSSPVWMGSE